ncbi:MAG: hypothetical protein FWD63_09790, partial [Propionibacteriaceae bacterium]|nr:hypothetical protein [Propionibacteriaceae bacterium]
MTDWSRLSHAYGKAVDTPNLIARLQGDGWEEALGDLYASILHQGTIYTATLPAIAELVQVVLNPTAQARVGAACLVADYADSVRVGWAHNPNYLPKKLNLAKFEAEAITALAEAVTALTPCLPDPDSDIRQYVAVLCQRTANLPAATEEALHKQLAVETDPAVIMALIAAVQAHDGLTNDEAVRLQDATPDARFAQAATALLKGPMTPSAVATAVELWNDCAAGFQQTGVSDALVDDIVAADWASAIPLLNGLAHQGGVALVDAIQGFYNLRWYRSATPEALNGLLDIAARAAN